MTKIPYADLRRVFLLATKELSEDARKVAWDSACQRPVSAWNCYAAIAEPEEVTALIDGWQDADKRNAEFILRNIATMYDPIADPEEEPAGKPK